MAENTQGGALVILDTSRPIAGRGVLAVDLAPEDVALTADGQASAARLSTVVDREVVSARSQETIARQEALEGLARDLAETIRAKVRGVNVGPSAEYALMLWLVAMSRDADLLRAARDRAADGDSPPGHAFARVVLVTDRVHHEGLARALGAATGHPVEVRRESSVRYLDRVLAQYPVREVPYTAEDLQHHAGQHKARIAAITGPTVFATPRQAQALAAASHVSPVAESSAGPDVSPVAEPTAGRDAFDVQPFIEGFDIAEPVAIASLGPFRFRRLDRRLRRAVERSMPEVLARTIRALDAEDLAGELGAVAEDYLFACLDRSLRAAAYAIEANAALLTDSRCVGLLVWNDVLPLPRALVDFAVSKRLATVMEQHGVVGVRTLHDRPRTDWVAAWGEASKRWWAECGYPEERIRVVGSAGLRLSGVSASPPEGTPRVLYASQPYVGYRLAEDLFDSQRTLLEVASACRAAGCLLVAKPHPLERHDRWGCEFGEEIEVQLDERIADLARTCSALVTRNSTSVLDALDAGIPCILVETEEFAAVNPFRGLLDVNPEWEEVSLSRRLRSAVDSPPPREELRAILEELVLPGDAAGRLREMLREVAAR